MSDPRHSDDASAEPRKRGKIARRSVLGGLLVFGGGWFVGWKWPFWGSDPQPVEPSEPSATPTEDPTDPPSEPVRFAVVADTGMDSTNNNTAASTTFSAIGASGVAFGLHLGDLAYSTEPGVEQEFADFVHEHAGQEFEWAMIPGNHEGLDPDYGGPEGNMALFAEYCAPTPDGIVGNYPYDYYFDRDFVRFIMISPNIENPDGLLTYENGTPEQEQLGAWIAEAKAADRFVIVGEHEPYLTIGEHRHTPDNLSSPELAAFEIAQGVDVVMAGHDHNISRSHQLTGTVEDQKSPVVVNDTGDFTRGEGTVFLVIGTGGHDVRSIGTVHDLWAMGSGTNSPEGVTFAYGEFEVTEDVIRYQLRPTSGPAVTDAFTITKR